MKDLTSFAKVEVGDVILCTWQMKDKETRQPYTWRWFGVVVDEGITTINLYRIGAEDEKLAVITCSLRPSWSKNDDRQYQLLDMDEWPDGIHALRMRLILEGRIDV